MTAKARKLEVVQQAVERLGEAPAQELADFIEKEFGLTIQPGIVTVLRASLRERAHLEGTWEQAQPALQAALAEQAEERRTRRKAGRQGPGDDGSGPGEMGRPG